MTLDGSDLINNPFGVIFKAFTDFFESILGPGGGNVFYLFPILILTFGLWVKNPDEPMLPVVFFIGSSALLGAGSLFMHAYGAAIISLVLCGFALTGLIMNTVLQKRRI